MSASPFIPLVAASLLLAANAASTHMAPQIAAEASALRNIDAFVLDALRRTNAPGVAISVVKDGRVVLSKGYGALGLGRSEPMTNTTIWPIQSETKTFTGLTAAILHDEGKLDLDRPVSSYIPAFRMHDPVATLEVTPRDFLTHRSGLPAHSWLWITNDGLTRTEAMSRMPHLPLVARIRSDWRYANMGYVTVAHLVERIAGVPWEQFVERRIFQPLGMTRTTFSRQQAEADPNHIDGSMIRFGSLVRTPMQGTTPLTNSTGGIYSTADDMAKWMLVHLNEGRADGRQLFKESTIAELQKSEMITDRPVPMPEFTSSAYGLGWFVESYRGERLVEHGGGHWGVNSALGLLPERELGVSVFVNQNSDLALYLMLSILDRYIGSPARDWVGLGTGDMEAQKNESEKAQAVRIRERIPDTSPSRPLSDYVGRYEHPGYGLVDVRLQAGNLAVQYDDDVSPLSHWHYDVFMPTARGFGNIWAMYEGMQVQFVTDYKGRVAELRLSHTADATFKKVQDP